MNSQKFEATGIELGSTAQGPNILPINLSQDNLRNTMSELEASQTIVENVRQNFLNQRKISLRHTLTCT